MRALLVADHAFDGLDTVIPAPRVLVGDDGKIVRVDSGGDGWESFDGIVHDLRGTTLLPGLIDGHVHMNFPGDGTSFEETLGQSDEQLSAVSLAAAMAAARGGVTTVRDLGGRRLTTYAAREAARRHGIPAARMLLAGPSLTITGGHCRFFGGEADGVEGVRAAVRRRIGEGADWIKVIGSGGGTPNTISHMASFTGEEVAAIVDEAHRFGVKVTMHCLCAEAMRNAVDAGVDGIEHGWFLTGEPGVHAFDREIASRVAAAGIMLVSTMAVGHFILDQYDGTELSPPEGEGYLDTWRSNVAHTLEQFGALRDAGVNLIGGTDAGWRFTPFDGMAVEAAMMVKGGMGAREALAACTGRSAEALGIGDVTGTLAPGRAADVIAVPGDATSDIDALTTPTLVMREGQLVGPRRGGRRP